MIDPQLLQWIIGAVAMTIGGLLATRLSDIHWEKKLLKYGEIIEEQEREITNYRNNYEPKQSYIDQVTDKMIDRQNWDKLCADDSIWKSQAIEDITSDNIGPLDKPYEEYTVTELNEIYGDPLGYGIYKKREDGPVYEEEHPGDLV